MFPPLEILKMYFGYKLHKPHFISEGMTLIWLSSVKYRTNCKGRELGNGLYLFVYKGLNIVDLIYFNLCCPIWE